MASPEPGHLAAAERRRVCVLSPSAEKYGSDRALLNALPELVEAYDVTVAFATGGPLVQEVEALGAAAIVLPDFAVRRRLLGPAMLAWPFRVVVALGRLHRLHKAQHFDLVYSNTLAAFIGPLLMLRWRVPHVVHAHECPLEPRWLTTLLLRMLRRCTVILCNSEYTRGLIVSFSPGLESRTTVVHNGIEIPDAAGPGPSLDRDDPLRITCVARIHPKKGHKVIIESLGIATREGRDWQLHCYGDALSEHRQLEQQVRELSRTLGVADRIAWHGFVEGWERYAAVDAAVVPSVYPEEFSLVAAEAQAVALPVIATGPGGASEVLADGVTGFVVPPRDPQAIFEALALVDDDRAAAAAMGVAGRARVEALFTRRAYAEAITARIGEALATPVRPSAPVSGAARPHMLIVAPSAEMYGSDRSLLNLLPELSETFAITIAYAGDGPAVALAREAGVDVVVLPDFAFRRSNIRASTIMHWFRHRHDAVRTLDAMHRERRFDIVYSNTLAAGLGHTLRRKWKIRGAVHVRECPPEPLWQLRALLAMVGRAKDLVICNSYYTESVVLRYAPYLRTRTVVVHNGIPLPTPAASVGVRPSGPLRISCVGRIHPKKGQGVLIEAAHIAKRNGRAWELHFYGDALPQHAALYDAFRRATIDAGIADHVVWHGFVSGDERYEDADVAVVPSVYPEEFSLVCVEGQGMGLPVVATGPGGPSEIIVDGETGFIVPPDDAHALYRALAALDDDRERAATMGKRGMARMHDRFSREVYAGAVRDQLLRLCRLAVPAPS